MVGLTERKHPAGIMTRFLTNNCFCKLCQNFNSHFLPSICLIKTRWSSYSQIHYETCCNLPPLYLQLLSRSRPKRVSISQQVTIIRKHRSSLNMILLWRRNGRLFFVSSVSTTSTISTTTLCYFTTSTVTLTACGRKRRSIKLSGDEGIQPRPSPVLRFVFCHL